MVALLRRILSYKFFPVCWTLMIIFLLCLPGSLVPGSGIFSLPNLDKLVHVFLFGMNVLFWGWHFGESISSSGKLRKVFVISVASTICLGVLLEYIQLRFIPNRSFDVADIMADITGAVIAGCWLWVRN